MPLNESQQVDGMFADPLMTGPSAIASKLQNDLSAKLERFNESSSNKLRDQPLCPKDTILATSSTMLVMMRIEILQSTGNHWGQRSRRIWSFYINQPAHHSTNHVCVSLLLQRFRYCWFHQRWIGDRSPRLCLAIVVTMSEQGSTRVRRCYVHYVL